MLAPDFKLPDQNNIIHSLSDYKGRWLLIYFYPKDDTPGCTKEACGFRDQLKEFRYKDIEVIGISKDTTSSHKRFHEKFNLNFVLLSDTSTETIKAYGAWGKKKFMGREYEGVLRNSYLINPNGEIIRSYENVDPLIHPEQILNDYVGSH